MRSAQAGFGLPVHCIVGLVPASAPAEAPAESGISMQAFDDITVLDLTQHIAGPYATRLLADFGADVIKVERSGGDPARRLGPFQGDDEHPEKSGLFFYLNCNKRSVVIDLKTDAGKQQLRRLAEGADLVVESFRPGV